MQILQRQAFKAPRLEKDWVKCSFITINLTVTTNTFSNL
jgi:hypothetical protein